MSWVSIAKVCVDNHDLIRRDQSRHHRIHCLAIFSPGVIDHYQGTLIHQSSELDVMLEDCLCHKFSQCYLTFRPCWANHQEHR